LVANSQRIYDYNYPKGPVFPEADPSGVTVIPFLWDLLGFDD